MPVLLKSRDELLQHLIEHPCLTPQELPLGNLLVDCGIIGPEQLEKALIHQHKHPEHGRLGQVLLALQMVTPEQLSMTLAQQLGVPQVSLEHFDIQEEAVKLVPESLARRFMVVPLLIDDERLIVASPDPTDSEVLHIRACENALTPEKSNAPTGSGRWCF